jgi:hypothetical protein
MMAADTVVVAGMEEAVIRAALAGMGLAVTGTVVTGMAGVLVGITVVMVAVGESAPR